MAGTYVLQAKADFLPIATSSRTLTVQAGPPESLVFSHVPSRSQAYAAPLRQPLSVRIVDRFGNHNLSSGYAVEISLPGLNARFLDAGWMRQRLTRYTVDGVANFTDVLLVPPFSFSSGATIVQAIHVDGFGPEQGGWGIRPGSTPLVELKGVETPGELVLMPSRIAAENRLAPCSQAGDTAVQEGNYAYPPEDDKPAPVPSTSSAWAS